VGGTSVLYLADISLGFLGWGGHLGDGPLPALSWQSLKKVPPVVVGMGTLMTGIYWVIRRRMQLAARAADEAGEVVARAAIDEADHGVRAGDAATSEREGGDHE
jgi:hypothetical protein